MSCRHATLLANSLSSPETLTEPVAIVRIQVNIPAESGEMGVLASHVPSIEQLKPGLVEVIEETGGSKQFFCTFSSKVPGDPSAQCHHLERENMAWAALSECYANGFIQCLEVLPLCSQVRSSVSMLSRDFLWMISVPM